MEETQSNSGELQGSNNQGYNNSDALRMRLDNEPLLQRLEDYLRGNETIVEIDQHNRPWYKQKNVSIPKANPTGVYNIMSWLRGILNTAIVQGNIENFDQLRNDLSGHRMDFVEMIMINRHKWGISDDDIEGISDLFLIQLKYFLSRLVKNKERESYANTIRHTESNSSVQRERGRSRFRVPGWGGT